MQTDDYGYAMDMTLDEAMAMITNQHVIAARGSGKTIYQHNLSVAWLKVVNAIHENKRFREKSHMSEIIITSHEGFKKAEYTCTNCGAKFGFHTYARTTRTDDEIRDMVCNNADNFCKHCGARLKEDGDEVRNK